MAGKKTSRELTVPDHFHTTAIAFPDEVKRNIALITDADEAADGLAKAEVVASYARRIKATTEEINHVEYGKLLLAAKVGELCPAASAAERGSQGGRGKKATKGDLVAFSAPVIADYRKLARHQAAGKIDGYFRAASEREHDTEMSIAGFLRFVSDGNLKANQNKGVIEWYTPENYIEASRKAMGSIDLDPASSDKANEVVKAERYYTAEDDGLGKPWWGNVFLNPPFQAKLMSQFVAKLCEAVEAGEVKQAVLLTNNNTDTRWWHSATGLCAVVCFTQGRIPFYNPVGEEASPTNGHTLFYFGKRVRKFCNMFKQFGTIMQRAGV